MQNTYIIQFVRNVVLITSCPELIEDGICHQFNDSLPLRFVVGISPSLAVCLQYGDKGL